MCRATYDHIAPSKRDRIHQHSAAGRWSLLSLEFRLEVTETDLADIASTGPVSRVLVHPSLCIGTVIINSANTDHRMHVHGTSTWTTLMRQISMSRLTHIEMYMCDLSSVDALQLALDGLPPTLNRLHLEDCSITENGARMIATKFHAAVFRLGNFSLRDNAIGDQGVEAIVQSLLVHTTLHRLDVIGTGCGPRTLASITNLLRTNMSLRLIRTLQGCHAWSRGDYDALVRAIAHVIKQLGLTQRAIEWDDDEFFIYTPLEDDYGASTNLP